jgi:hypothetical protein
MTNVNIGELLRRAGAVTQAQIDDAVDHAFRSGCRIGASLIAIGACSPADLSTALDRQRRIAAGSDASVDAFDELLQDTFRCSSLTVEPR